MKNKDWLYVILPLIASWSIDRITKTLAATMTGMHFFAFFGLVLHHNSGAIMGIFSDIPPVLRIVSLSTGGAFLLSLFFLIQFLLPTKSLALRIGLSLLISGIIGNVTDRIIWGYVVDFVVLGTREHFSPAFNFADAIQWVGYAVLVIVFAKEGKELWPAENARKKFWINPRFQMKYCFIMVACGLCLTLVLGVYSYTYLTVIMREIPMGVMASGRAPIYSYLITFGIVSLTFCVVLFAVGLVLSHRAAGPLYAFERFLDDLVEGKEPRLKLRAGDEFKHLEQLANKLSGQFHPRTGTTAKTKTS
jgi:signal peptidase II